MGSSFLARATVGHSSATNTYRVKGRGAIQCNRALHATNCNVDTHANIVAVHTDCHCIVQSVLYQLRLLDK